GEFLLKAAGSAHEPIGVSALIRQGIDAGMLDGEGAGDRVDVRGVAILVVWPSIDAKAGMTVVVEMRDEGVDEITVVHRGLILSRALPNDCDNPRPEWGRLALQAA
ncbi:MAG: hypothetical protein ACRDGM_08880, partial [bacterium]